MALELHQTLKLRQQMVMTPQLRQAIKLLLYSRVELQEAVQQEMLENPFLEESEGDVRRGDEELSEMSLRKESHDDDVYDREVARDAQWEDYLGEFSSTSRQAQQREYDSGEDQTPLEARYAARPTLEAHLLWQLHLSNLSKNDVRIGEEIIGNLSSQGYLEATIEEIAKNAGASVDACERVLKRIQRFDPVGVAARTPTECLLIQLADLDYDRDPILVELVTHHLEDIEAKRYRTILK